MISEAQRAEIRCLFYADHWRIGTIAREPALHPDTVRPAVTSHYHDATILTNHDATPGDLLAG